MRKIPRPPLRCRLAGAVGSRTWSPDRDALGREVRLHADVLARIPVVAVEHRVRECFGQTDAQVQSQQVVIEADSPAALHQLRDRTLDGAQIVPEVEDLGHRPE
jgi:hypothetical protein